MIEFVIGYLVIGAVVASMLIEKASKHPLYTPTMVAWVIVTILWPYYLPKFIWRLIRG